jgi:hypothetical protein
MGQSKAKTVQEYLDELPEERRAIISIVRDLIIKNLPEGYREAINFGMISYEVPLEDYPDTYNGQPLNYMALAAQKNHNALYMMCVYQNEQKRKILMDAYKEKGIKPNMGKSCLRFKSLDKLPLEVIGKLVASTPPSELIASYEESRSK